MPTTTDDLPAEPLPPGLEPADPELLNRAAREAVLRAAYPDSPDHEIAAMVDEKGALKIGAHGVVRLAALLGQGRRLADLADNVYVNRGRLWAQAAEYRIVEAARPRP